jgi:hypothetical protein
MYWIYLIIFIIAIFTPDIIQRDFSWIPEEKAEELMILALGVLAFTIFIAKEKQMIFQMKAKRLIQKEASLASKDLTDTYSYIGEINRKMDIFKDIALGLTEGSELTAEKEMELYHSIIHAVQMFTKSTHVSLRFINVEKSKIIREIKSSKKARCDIVNPIMKKENRTFLETENIFFIRAPKPINNITVCIAIEKRNKSQKIEDPELIKALAAQALFLFTFPGKNVRG